MNKLLALIKNDFKLILRDKFTVVMFSFPVLLILLLKIFFNYLEGFPIGQILIPILFAVVYVEIPLFYGIVNGFMIIEEKEENVFNAIRILPIGSNQYILYRLGFGFLFTFCLSMIFPIIFPAFAIKWYNLIILSLIIGSEAPLIAIFLSSFAKNKVEGITIIKLANIMFNAPIAYYFLAEEWQFLFGIIPSFWPMKIVLSTAVEVNFSFLFYVGAILYHIVIFIGSLRYFRKKIF